MATAPSSEDPKISHTRGTRSIWNRFGLVGGEGKDISVGPVGAVLIVVATVVVGLWAVYYLVEPTLASFNPDNATKQQVLWTAVLGGALGGIVRFVAEAFQPFKEGKPLYWTQVALSLLQVIVGAIFGILVWALTYGGLLIQLTNVGSGANIQANLYGILGISIVAGMYADKFVKIPKG